MKLLLAVAALVLAATAVSAATGCPPGNKHQCTQGKVRVVCSCH
jgi:hypothetical protein